MIDHQNAWLQITTARLNISSAQHHELNFMREIFAEPTAASMFHTYPNEADVFAKFMNNIETAITSSQDLPTFLGSIYTKDDKQFVGFIWLVNNEGICDVIYGLNAHARGKGYAKEAINAVLDFYLPFLVSLGYSIKSVKASVLPNNSASLKLVSDRFEYSDEIQEPDIKGVSSVMKRYAHDMQMPSKVRYSVYAFFNNIDEKNEHDLLQKLAKKYEMLAPSFSRK